MSIIKMRLKELFGWCIGLSAVMTALGNIGIVPGENGAVGLTMFWGMLIFTAVQAFILRECFYALENRFDYLFANILAYLIFAAVSMLARPLLGVAGMLFDYPELGRIVHTWLFGIFKFAMFTKAELHWAVSSLIGHALMLVLIYVAPAGMKIR